MSNQEGNPTLKPEKVKVETIDLTYEDIEPRPSSYEEPSTTYLPVEYYRARSEKAMMRTLIAGGGLFLFGIIIVMGFWKTETWADAKELLDQLLPVVTLMIGAVLGFYFGKEVQED